MDQRHGFTLTEVVILLAVIAIVAAATWTQGSSASSDARWLASALSRVRAEAVSRGVGLVVAGQPCIAGSGAFGAVTAPTASVAWPPRGLLFTPDGLPRTCDGGGVGNTTIVLEHRGRQAAVIVSSLGRVRWEPR